MVISIQVVTSDMTPGRKPRVTDEELMETLEGMTGTNANPVVTTEEVAEVLPLAHDSVYDRLSRFYDEGKVHKKKVGARGLVWWPVKEN